MVQLSVRLDTEETTSFQTQFHNLNINLTNDSCSGRESNSRRSSTGSRRIFQNKFAQNKIKTPQPILSYFTAAVRRDFQR